MTTAPDYQRRFRITPTDALMLQMLASGNVIAKTHLGADDNTVRVHICSLRKAIAPIQIRTVHGAGYCIDEPHLSALRGQG